MGDQRLLPQLDGEVFLTDGGLETDLIFHRGLDLPQFASFALHDDADAEAVVRDYFSDYLRIGEKFGGGLVLENHPVGPLVGVAFNLTAMSYCGSWDMGLNMDPAAVSQPDLLRRCVEGAFAEVAAAAG